MKNKSLLIVLATVLVAFGAAAQKRASDEAMSIANSFLPKQKGELSLAYTSKSKLRSGSSEGAYYYVFNRGSGGGYVIVSADTRTKSVLGYSDTGSFDPGNMPENFRAWLDYYEAEMESLDSQSAALSVSTPVQRQTAVLTSGMPATSVAPFIATRWDQNAPYNALCPTVEGQKSPTGCVATAMAQIMKHYGHPATGEGSHSYTPPRLGSELSVDFGAATYDWANMPNTLTASSTDAQKNAVATLMYHCGVAVDMDYQKWSSGATYGEAGVALVQYFGYEKPGFIYRSHYSSTDWADIIKMELTEGRPVLVGGLSSLLLSTGHAFVCDGYNTSGLFHFNWGWSGAYDGYFEMSVLKPDREQYNQHLQAIIGIRPATSPVVDKSYVPTLDFVDIACTWFGNVPVTTIGLDRKYDPFRIQVYGIQNISLARFEGKLGLAIYDESDSLVAYTGGRNVLMNDTLDPTTYYRADYPIRFEGSLDDYSLPAGTYRIYPAYTYGDTHDTPIIMQPHYGETGYITLTVASDGSAAVTTTAVTPVLEFRGFTPTTLSGTVDQHLTVRVANTGTGEYHSNLKLMLGTLEVIKLAEIRPGAETDIDFTFDLSGVSGIRSARLYYSTSNDHSGAATATTLLTGSETDITVTAPPAGLTELRLIASNTTYTGQTTRGFTFTNSQTGAAVNPIPVSDYTVEYEMYDGAVYTVIASQPVNAGRYRATVTVVNTASYQLPAASSAIEFEITRKAIQIRADNKYANIGDPLPTLSYTISGLVNGETSADALDGEPQLSCTADMTTAGQFTINVNIAGATTKANYMFDTPPAINALLTVNDPTPPPPPPPPVLSSDASLYSLSVSEGTLSPTFSPDIRDYTVNVSYETATIVIEGTANGYGATVYGNGEKRLETGLNSFVITVEAEDGSRREYNVAVSRAIDTSNDRAKASRLSFYLDHSHTLLYIESDSPVRAVRVYDMYGRRCVDSSGAVSISLDGLRSGVYVVRVETGNGVRTGKVVL